MQVRIRRQNKQLRLGSMPCEAGTQPSLLRHRPKSAPSSPALTTETTYHYRVVVEDANGTKYGTDQTYTPHTCSA